MRHIQIFYDDGRLTAGANKMPTLQELFDMQDDLNKFINSLPDFDFSELADCEIDNAPI